IGAHAEVLLKALQIQMVGLHARRCGTREGRRPRSKQRGDNRSSDLVLNLKDLTHPTVVVLRPDVKPRPAADQLSRHAKVVTGPADAAFQNRRDAQPLPY